MATVIDLHEVADREHDVTDLDLIALLNIFEPLREWATRYLDREKLEMILVGRRGNTVRT